MGGIGALGWWGGGTGEGWVMMVIGCLTSKYNKLHVNASLCNVLHTVIAIK